jgi:hypothetical protein
MNLIKTEKDQFLRDDSNHALLNTDINAYKQYIQTRRSQKKVMDVEKEVSSLKKEIGDVKSMLMVLINQNNKEI